MTRAHTPDDLTNLAKPQRLEEVIDEATTRIRTESLVQHGVGNLRILSQSRFLHLVEQMVETTLESHVGDVKEALLAQGPIAPAAQPGQPAHEAVILGAAPGVPAGVPFGYAPATVVPFSPPAAPVAPSPAAPSPAVAREALDDARSELGRRLQGEWERLRENHAEHLERLETRLTSLASAVGGVHDAFQRLEEKRVNEARQPVPKFLRRRLEQTVVCDAEG